MLPSLRAVRSSRDKWMPGPIATVMGEHNRPKAPAAARIIYDSWRSYTESSRGGIFVIGNDQINVIPQSIRLTYDDQTGSPASTAVPSE
jgi:hypothetical protein